MAIGLAQSVHTEKVGAQTSESGKNQGTLKSESKEYSVIPLSDSESVTEPANKFLQDINQKDSLPETLQEREFVHITPQLVENESEIARLLADLTSQQLSSQPSEKNSPNSANPTAPEHQSTSNAKTPLEGKKPHEALNSKPQLEGSSKGKPEVFSSLFSLARNINSSLFTKREPPKSEAQKGDKSASREDGRPQLNTIASSPFERLNQEQNRMDREGNGKQDRQGKDEDKEQQDKGQHQEQKQSALKSPDKKKGIVGAIGGVQAARNDPPPNPRNAVTGVKGATEGSSGVKTPRQVVNSVENIYIRFMALMARILGQAELEAHDLYLRIKERTDNIDTLTLLLSKINSEKGAIDWTNNEDMKKLIEKARALGVEIPKDKLKWSEEEKKLFKENIQMRKDSMEKMTQLERTDMQRYLQEASQCHQARSNVLKLLKEVTDTILANMRP